MLIDAGLGPRSLAERLHSAGVDPASLSGVLLSHEHGDHAKGAAAFSEKWGVPLVGTRGTWGAAGFGAQGIAGYQRLEAGGTIRLGAVAVAAVPVPHDGASPLAFVLEADGVAFGHATDLGHVNPALVAAFRPCRALLLESNYDPALLRDGPYPWALKERILGPRGHLANADTARYLGDGLGPGCVHVLLAHLSEKNNHPELVLMAAENALAAAGRREVRVTVTPRDGCGWVDVLPPARPAPESGGPEQLTLF